MTAVRAFALALAISAVVALSLLTTGLPSTRWWVVIAIPLALYSLYALGLYVFLPKAPPSRPRRQFQKPTESEVDWLLLLRGLAAALVFVMHSGILLGHDFTWGHRSWSWVTFSPAWLGMLLFFTLSGYLMGKSFHTGRYSLNRSSVLSYLRNRSLRIIPLMVAVGVLVIVWQSPRLLATPQVPVRLFEFQFNGLGGTDSIGAFWSLTTEWQFYLLVPAAFVVMFIVARRRSLLLMATLLVVAGGCAIRYYQWHHHGGIQGWSAYVYTPLCDNIDVFLIGFLANWWIPKLRMISTTLSNVWPLLLVAIYLAYAYISYQSMGLYNLHWFPTFAIVTPTLTALALLFVIAGCEALNDRQRQDRTRRRRTAVVLFWMGALTYPVYLVHSSILDGVEIGIPHAPYLVRWLVAFALVLFIAWLLHITVERAALDWRTRSASSESTLPADVEAHSSHNGVSIDRHLEARSPVS